MDEWLQRLATTVGVDALSDEQAEALLDVARDVAHGVERKATPLATFLVGAAVERAVARGLTHEEAFIRVVAELRTTL